MSQSGAYRDLPSIWTRFVRVTLHTSCCNGPVSYTHLRVQRTLGNVLKYLLLGAFLANIPQLAIFPQLELAYRLRVYISRQNICLGLLVHRVNGIQRFAAALVLYFLLQFCFCDFPG